MNIAVFLGGISPERNVSFASGKAVVEALRVSGHTVIAIDPARGTSGIINNLDDLPPAYQIPDEQELAAFPTTALAECVFSPLLDSVDCIFLALHGKYGEDGYIQSLLDLRGKRYTGSKMLASAVAMSKYISKRLFQSAGIPTPPFVRVTAEHAAEYDFLKEIRAELGPDLVIKPDDQGSTVGITFVHHGNLDDLEQGIKHAALYSPVILVERFIEGRELTASILGDEALPIIDIQPHEGEYDYTNKYTKGRTNYICPADLDEETTDFIHNLALEAHRITGCTAYSRVDFRLDDEGQPFCLEVNTLPGMTETSLVPKAADAAGISFTELCERIIELS